MTAIAKIPTPKAALTSGNAVAAMVPNSIESAWRLSEVIAASGMAPKTYGTDPNKIMVGMLAGMEIGLTPFAALQSIAVINGNPSLWGDGALALIQASNLLEDMDETDDGNEATCMMKRAGRATPIVRTFSMEDAKRAGLVGKAGPWTQYTRRMRQMRARSIAMRDGFADVLKGLRIAEEVRDYAEFSDATPRPAQGVNVPLSGAMLLEQASDEGTPAASLPDAAAVTPSTSAEQLPTGAASNEDKEAATRDWARKTLALIDAAETREELDQLMAKRATGLEKVRGVLKTLADEIDAVAALKKSFLSGIVALDADAPGLDGDGYDPAAA